MKIAFDYQIFTLQSYGGISRYFVRLAQELLAKNLDVQVVAPIHQNRYLKEMESTRVHGFGLKKFPPKTTRLLSWINKTLSSSITANLQPDVLHETYYSLKTIPVKSQTRILTVYDMIHEKFSTEFNPNDRTPPAKKVAVARADHIICISQSTKNDLCELFGTPEEKISVVHLGFDKITSTQQSTETVSSGRPFLLYVGNRGGYKNFSSTLRAVAASRNLSQELDIIAFGGGAFNTREIQLINSLKFRAGAIQQISGDDFILGKLYNSASIFVYPSLYEGFGLPPLEAMAHDCPVVASYTSSMPEIIGNAGCLFDPNDISAQTHAIETVFFNSEKRNELVENGRTRLAHFSWARCAEETLNVYRNVTNTGAVN